MLRRQACCFGEKADANKTDLILSTQKLTLKTFLLFALGTLVSSVPASANFQDWLENHAAQNATETRQLVFPLEGKGDFSTFLIENNARAEGVSLADEYPPSDRLKGRLSALFEGDGNALIIEKWNDLGFSNHVSMGVWIKPDFSMFQESRESRFIVSKSASTEAGFFITITADYKIGVGLVTSDGNVVARTEKPLEMYRWHHVGWSWNGEKLQIYLDGEPSGAAVEISGVAKDYATAPLTFGRPASLEGNYYRGFIGDFILYPEAYESGKTP